MRRLGAVLTRALLGEMGFIFRQVLVTRPRRCDTMWMYISISPGKADRMSRMAAKDRREELISAAFRVMVRDGVVKATTRAIVNEAKMPLGVFHYCFSSREELLQEVLTRFTERSAEASREALHEGGDLSARIAKSLAAFWEGVELSPGQHQVSYELTHYALRQAGFEELARRQYQSYLEVHKALLTEAASSEGIRWTAPVPVLARYLNAVLDGLTLCWLVDRNSEDSREVLRLTGEHLLSFAAEKE
ncbi:TetR/AcrR family transcriptional regulator [Streptomyces sp. NPDC096013]|uniref:TetR/AcrR family transcriptional regulator n=1 Tax=Streptomyces sp. NPDC096013 TaxID=3366069 RepID=UPI0038077605